MRKLAKLTLVATTFLTTTVSVAHETKEALGPKGVVVFSIEKNALNNILDPVFKKKGDKLFLNLLNLDLGNVYIKIMDSEGRLVYRDKVEEEVVVGKAFNFENAFEGEYTVIVSDGEKTYEEVVIVE